MLALALFFWLLLTLRSSYAYHFGFNQERWLETGKLLRSDKEDRGILGTSNPRESMAEDVMAHHLAPGMTRGQVLAVLGPPEREGVEMSLPVGVHIPDSLTGENYQALNKWYAEHSQPDTIMRYQVGWDIIDPTSMRVEFGGDERVKKYWVGLH